MLVHTPSDSLLLNVPDPFAVREVLTKSRLLDHPQWNVAVKHTLEAAKVLRNMGFNAPAPIRYQYSWPGKFKPFAHQVVMSEFLTLHRRAFNLSEMGCVDADTEYLSPVGWKRIANYTEGYVAQYHPETGAIEFVNPTEFVKLPCSEMIRFHTTRGVDQLLSPEHRVLLADGRVVSAQHILDHYGTQSLENRSFRFRTTFSVPGAPGIPLTDAQIRVQVAANADGWFRTDRAVYVRVKKARKIARMRRLLRESGITFRERSVKPEGFITFSFEAPWSKGFDEYWWAASAEQLQVITAEAPHWDGMRRAGGTDCFFGTLTDATFVQYAFSACGRRATLRQQAHCWEVTAKAGDPTVGLIQRNTNRSPNARVEPSVDGFKYCFMVPSTFLLFRRNGCIFASGNTAKTNAALWAADWLMKTGRVDKALVLSPLSTLERVWQNDIFDTLMHRKAAIVHGPIERRMQRLAADVDFYIMNHDGLGIARLMDAIMKRPDINLVIVDEASMFRNHQTQKYKALEKLCKRQDVRLWLLTGTPCPNDPTDAWALAKLVSPGRVPKFFGGFKRETMLQVTQFKWVPKADAYNTAFAALQPAVRFKKADCLDLPPVTNQDRQCELSKEQRDAFENLRKTMVVEAQSGTKVTAANAADKIGKLRQILCGAIKLDDQYEVYDHGPRLKVLLESIAEASAKVLVVAPFKGIVRALEKEIGEHYTVGVLNGDVSPNARNTIIKEFKTQKDPHVLLCHPKVMAHGLNLTEADTLIFYAPIYSNDEFQQVTERFNRAGQTRKMTIVRMAAHPLEWQIFKLLDNRQSTQDSILNLFKQVTE